MGHGEFVRAELTPDAAHSRTGSPAWQAAAVLTKAKVDTHLFLQFHYRAAAGPERRRLSRHRYLGARRPVHAEPASGDPPRRGRRRFPRGNRPFPGRPGPGTYLRCPEPFSARGLVEGRRRCSGRQTCGRHPHRLGRLLRSGEREGAVQRGAATGRHRDTPSRTLFERACATVAFDNGGCGDDVRRERRSLHLSGRRHRPRFESHPAVGVGVHRP